MFHLEKSFGRLALIFLIPAVLFLPGSATAEGGLFLQNSVRCELQGEGTSRRGRTFELSWDRINTETLKVNDALAIAGEVDNPLRLEVLGKTLIRWCEVVSVDSETCYLVNRVKGIIFESLPTGRRGRVGRCF